MWPVSMGGKKIRLKCFHCNDTVDVQVGESWPKCCRRRMMPEWAEKQWEQQSLADDEKSSDP